MHSQSTRDNSQGACRPGRAPNSLSLSPGHLPPRAHGRVETLELREPTPARAARPGPAGSPAQQSWALPVGGVTPLASPLQTLGSRPDRKQLPHQPCTSSQHPISCQNETSPICSQLGERCSTRPYLSLSLAFPMCELMLGRGECGGVAHGNPPTDIPGSRAQ